MKQQRVEFAYPYTGADGVEYKPGDSAVVDAGKAADLVVAGLARKVEEPKDEAAGETAGKVDEPKTETAGKTARKTDEKKGA